MHSEIQIETLYRTKTWGCAVLFFFVLNSGCRLVDGQDPGASSLILNSMAVSSTCSADAVVAESYSCKPTVSISEAVDSTHLTWELTAENTCSWLKINPTTGDVFGVPPRDQIGSCNLALRVVTSEKPSSNFVQPLTVHGPKLTFIDKNCPLTAPVDTAYICDFEATTLLSSAHITYSLNSDNSCNWAVINPSNGDVSGTPNLAATGSCVLSVKAAIDSIASSVSKITVTTPKVAVKVSASCSLSADPGVAYSCAPSASAAVTSPSFSWSLSASNSCNWLSINPSTGLVSGTPLVQSVGSCRLDLTAQLADGSFGQTSFTIGISTKGYNQNQLSDLNSNSFDNSGASVAMDGNFAVIGSPNSNSGVGSASVYQFDGVSWHKNAVLSSPNPTQFRSFGYSVAISGNSILVGAPDSTMTNTRDGAVVAYEWNGSSWNQTQILVATGGNGQFLMALGSSIDIDGTTALVGTSHYLSNAAYVLNKSGSLWSFGPALDFPAIGSNNGPSRIKVALQGGLAVISDTHGGASQNGEVRVFRGNLGTWTAAGTISASANKGFGSSVATDNNKILIGAPQDKNNAGAAYLYEYGQNSWIQTNAFVSVDSVGGQACGTSVSLNANQAAVGCMSSTVPGSAYVYSLNSTLWSLDSKIVSTNRQAQDEFGVAVSISGRNVLIGADQFSTTSNPNSGTAYLFRTKN